MIGEATLDFPALRVRKWRQIFRLGCNAVPQILGKLNAFSRAEAEKIDQHFIHLGNSLYSQFCIPGT